MAQTAQTAKTATAAVQIERLGSMVNYLESAKIDDDKRKICIGKLKEKMKPLKDEAFKQYGKMYRDLKTTPKVRLIEVESKYKPYAYAEYGEEFLVDKVVNKDSTPIQYWKAPGKFESQQALLYFKQKPKKNPKSSSSRSETNATGGKAPRRRL